MKVKVASVALFPPQAPIIIEKVEVNFLVYSIVKAPGGATIVIACKNVSYVSVSVKEE